MGEWKTLYFQGSCIKQVDDARQRLLFQIPGFESQRLVWISMKLIKFEESVGNGYYRKLFYKDHFIFRGHEYWNGLKFNYAISAPFLAMECTRMDNHIRQTMADRRRAEENHRKKADWQSRRY